ncbi:hypothetical protein ABE855_09545 [Enterococcus faecalis]|uniref:hypothetical protein n=1 Tax=Enterococcus faecalis TaxID=1351 RepID=UPI000DEACCA2|nr:hypothetical protein [Enterococcus faecalis]EGO8268988.1 hypothetical protein [Enterococcus faecalis]MDK0511629.1 hypothetical protein [Enterococcus faecalis]NSV25962.1 hypothetical protein [Enterococcus faecalis]RBR66562.1 hypothetical protein EB42_02627 [Enterococcus faecalis]
MSTKMSTLFHEFVYDNELNGIDEIIREANAVVAEDDIEVGTMLDDQVGEKYFYKCMELAENVIKSFEDEQPELNENQQIVLDWLKESCKLNGLREVIEIMGFLPTTGGKMKYKQVAYAYSDLNDDELKQVLQTLINLLEQEEAE